MILFWETEHWYNARLAAEKMTAIIVAVTLLLATSFVTPWEGAAGPEARTLYQTPVCADRVELYSGRTDEMSLLISKAAGSVLESLQENENVQTVTAAENREETLKEKEIPTTVPAEEKVSSEKTEFSEQIPLSVFYSGSLGTAYCVGADPDFSNVTVTDGTKTDSLSAYETEGWDSSSEGTRYLTVHVSGEKLTIPYSVAEYKVCLHTNGGAMDQREVSLWNYRLPELEEPVCPGKSFTGWYMDPECTIPFECAPYGETYLPLYAGWTDFQGFVCDQEGFITGYTNRSVTDGLLVLPSDSGCVGIRKGAFHDFTEVQEVYIPSGITYIEQGAFEGMENLLYIEVSPDNPVYKSVNGTLFKKTGEKVL